MGWRSEGGTGGAHRAKAAAAAAAAAPAPPSGSALTPPQQTGAGGGTLLASDAPVLIFIVALLVTLVCLRSRRLSRLLPCPRHTRGGDTATTQLRRARERSSTDADYELELESSESPDMRPRQSKKKKGRSQHPGGGGPVRMIDLEAAAGGSGEPPPWDGGGSRQPGGRDGKARSGKCGRWGAENGGRGANPSPGGAHHALCDSAGEAEHANGYHSDSGEVSPGEKRRVHWGLPISKLTRYTRPGAEEEEDKRRGRPRRKPHSPYRRRSRSVPVPLLRDLQAGSHATQSASSPGEPAQGRRSEAIVRLVTLDSVSPQATTPSPTPPDLSDLSPSIGPGRTPPVKRTGSKVSLLSEDAMLD